MKAILKNLIHFITAETVLFISGTAAIITMFFVKPSINYIDYVDFRVLVLLFCLMAVVSGFNKTGVFLQLSEKLLKKVVGIRSLSFVLIMLCFFSSMWITNDVALITFVPFAVMVLNIAGQSKYTLRIVVLQTIAANLGSMLTPVGNPQNLYLYSFYNIPILHFLKITLPFTVFSFLLLIVTILMIKKEPLEIEFIMYCSWWYYVCFISSDQLIHMPSFLIFHSPSLYFAVTSSDPIAPRPLRHFSIAQVIFFLLSS